MLWKINWYQRIFGTTWSWLLQQYLFNWYLLPWQRTYLPLMRSMKERQFLLAVNLKFSIYASPSKEVRTISDITIIGASLLSYTSVNYTIGSQRTTEKEGSREGGRNNRTTGGYCNVRFPNGKIYLKRTHWFWNGCDLFNKKTYYCKQVGRDCFVTRLDSIIHHHWHVCYCRSICVLCLICS